MWRDSEKFIDVLLTAKFREAAGSAAGETPMPDLVSDEPTAHVHCPHDGCNRLRGTRPDETLVARQAEPSVACPLRSTDVNQT